MADGPEPAQSVDRAPAPGTGSLLRHPGLLGFLGSRTLSSMSFQVQSVAIGWGAYQMTHRPLTLGLIGLSQFVPMLLLVFVSGHVADRFDRRRVAMMCQLVEAACGLVLAYGTFRHLLTPAALYGLVAVIGSAKAFEGPSLQALLPSLVSPGLFTRVAALNSSLFQTATIVGPSAGGLLYMAGPGIAYLVCTVLFLLAAAATGLIRLDQPPRPRGPVSLATVFGGLAFIWSRPRILGAISLDLFAVLLGGATALLPVYALDILHGSPFALGLLRAAPALGAVAISMLLSYRPIQGKAGPLMFGAVAVFGLATILFGVSRLLPLSILAMAVLGAADVVSVVIRSTLVQLNTPDEMRGRVAAVNSLFIVTSNQLGEFESGSVAALIGTTPAVVVGGIGTLVVAAIWMRLFPSLRRLDRLDEQSG